MVYFGENPQAKKQKHKHFWVKIEGMNLEQCKCGKVREMPKYNHPTVENIPNRWADKKKD